MPSRCLPLALLLLGCPPSPQPPSQPPSQPAPVIDARGDSPEEPARVTTPPRDEPPATTQPPAFSAPKQGAALADTLPPPEPRALPGRCEGGTRRPGETWKVDCNECSCGDDGQSRCTAMACLPRPAI